MTDSEVVGLRIRTQMMHIRNSRRDSVKPPKEFEHLEALLNLADTNSDDGNADEGVGDNGVKGDKSDKGDKGDEGVGLAKITGEKRQSK